MLENNTDIQTLIQIRKMTPSQKQGQTRQLQLYTFNFAFSSL